MTPIVSTNEVTLMVDRFCEVNGIPRTAVVLGGGAGLMLRGIRETTADINIWINEEYFTRLAEQEKVICHPLVDTVFNPKEQAYFWVRKRNHYFEVDKCQGYQVFNILTYLIHKRGGINSPARPLAKRQQDRADLIKLDALFKEMHPVKS